jgi:lipid II:glycine glycyltransferase (peptidoglycan interpeptide bridge formation enzyme)
MWYNGGMNFVELGVEEFRDFANNHPDKSFYQTPEIAKLREKSGWTAKYYGVKKDDKILAGSLILGKTTNFGFKTFYAPGGPLVNYEDSKLTNYFLTHLCRRLQEEKGLNLSIDPYYELIERDRDGLVKEGGFNRKKAVSNLRNLGFKALKEAIQPKYLFVLDINGKSADELLMEFKRNTRNHVRKAERMGVMVRELGRDELDKFKKITEATSERRHFTDKPLSYYEEMYDLFHEKKEVMFMVAEASIEGKTTVLSAAMFMTYGDEVIYLFSGSDEQYMRDYNAQYAIQWHMIKFAAENGFKTYNFYGIQGLPDEKAKDYGIYEFKKGFTADETGRVVEFLGTYEKSLSALYPLYKFLSKIKH